MRKKKTQNKSWGERIEYGMAKKEHEWDATWSKLDIKMSTIHGRCCHVTPEFEMHCGKCQASYGDYMYNPNYAENPEFVSEVEEIIIAEGLGEAYDINLGKEINRERGLQSSLKPSEGFLKITADCEMKCLALIRTWEERHGEIKEEYFDFDEHKRKKVKEYEKKRKERKKCTFNMNTYLLNTIYPNGMPDEKSCTD